MRKGHKACQMINQALDAEFSLLSAATDKLGRGIARSNLLQKVGIVFLF